MSKVTTRSLLLSQLIEEVWRILFHFSFSRRFALNGKYSVWPDGADGLEENVYCRMSKIPGCDEGGWTLVMKIDGNKVMIESIEYEHWHVTMRF